LVTEQRDLVVDVATQQLIQSVLSEDDKATISELEVLHHQCGQLRRQINELA